MAIGDAAISAGYPLVPDSGEGGKVKWGAREINRTRDFIAQQGSQITQQGSQVTQQGSLVAQQGSQIAQQGSQIAQLVNKTRYGTADPTGGIDGDIYFKVL